MNKLYFGDNLEILREMPDERVHLFDLGTGDGLIIVRTFPCYTFYKASGNYPHWSCHPRTRV